MLLLLPAALTTNKFRVWSCEKGDLRLIILPPIYMDIKKMEWILSASEVAAKWVGLVKFSIVETQFGQLLRPFTRGHLITLKSCIGNFCTVFLTAVKFKKLRKAHCSPPLVDEDNSMVFTTHSVPFPATRNLRLLVAGNETSWETKTISFSSHQWL